MHFGKSKYISVLYGLFFLISTIGLLPSCREESTPPDFKQFTITEFINQDPNFSILSEAMELTGLAEILNGDREFTFMAPTNKAFEAIGIQSVDDRTSEEWERIVRYHLTEEARISDSLLNRIQETLLPGYFWYVSEVDRQLLVNSEVKILVKDISTSNGEVHGLEQILEPVNLNLLEVSESLGFSIFVDGLKKTGFDELLSGEGLYTVFVPSNEAFEAYFEKQGITKEDWLASTNLRSFISLFILEGMKQSSDLVSGELETIESGMIYFSRDIEDGLWINGQASIGNRDINAGNGLINSVDIVYTLPDKSLVILLSESSNSANYSEFEAAMIYSGLINDLEVDGTGPFTIFAPNNEAFNLWYQELGVTGYYQVDEDLLRATLQYHVALGRVFTQDFRKGDKLNTWLEGSLLELDSDGPKVNETNLVVDYVNKYAVNGVFHGITAVLDPGEN
ncbi:fasciclin domain-containing protein [Echinicola shivajiensis]|uniref:fasciclin domain-containing protein n=1 Tax=Echinicola shivajiensis TaxID=1035916 RepID=UPI001BFC4A95|nr:fasciclin domain-containing protein [Echinicola shivajiensis]